MLPVLFRRSFHLGRPLAARSTLQSSQKPFADGSGPDFRHFLQSGRAVSPSRLPENDGAKVHVETYGCAMNVSDTEIIFSLLSSAGYQTATNVDDADVILLNTCAIRENAEAKVWERLVHLRAAAAKRNQKRGDGLIIGVLGCMAERLKTSLLERDGGVDLVVGPDAYRDLPAILQGVRNSEGPFVNVQLSLEETYGDVAPVRSGANGVTSFLSIMRGCANMCAFCIVPFTRGRERSRLTSSIEDEVRRLVDKGYKEVTLLGQNVNSYKDTSTMSTWDADRARAAATLSNQGFRTVYRRRDDDQSVRFAELVDRVANIAPEMRVRFTSPHPKDFPQPLLDVMAERPNVCKQVHMPAQSGSTSVLQKMRRGYTREAYLELVRNIRESVPGVSLTSDFIVGFCGETDEDFQETISLMQQVGYDMAYMFAYSMREKTHAHRRMIDDVPPAVKQARLSLLIKTYHDLARQRNLQRVDEEHLVLVEKRSKKSVDDWMGRNDGGVKVVFRDAAIPCDISNDGSFVNVSEGDFIRVRITDATSGTLTAHPIARTNITTFAKDQSRCDA